MAFTWQININIGTGGTGYVYSPSTLAGVAIADEVFFTNNTDSAKYPGLIAIGGVANVQNDYFMQFQIAPHTSSTTWVAAANNTLMYANSLDKSPTKPTGTILVTDPAPASATIASQGAK